MQMPTQAPFAPPPGPPPQQARAYVALRTGMVMLVVVIAATIVSSLLPGSLVAARNRAYPQPSINLTASSSNAQLGDAIQFSVQVQSGNDLTFTWSFGDNIAPTSGGAVMSHTYSSYCQSCTVTVTATDPIQHSATASTTVSVLPPPPTASFVFQEVDTVSFCVQFDASSSTGVNPTYNWSYGDGSSPDQEQSPSAYHCFYQSGTYTVALLVTDSFGQTGQISHTVKL